MSGTQTLSEAGQKLADAPAKAIAHELGQDFDALPDFHLGEGFNRDDFRRAASAAALLFTPPEGEGARLREALGDLETELLWPVAEEMERLEADLRNVGDDLSATQGDAASYLALAQSRIRSVMDLVEAVSRAPRPDASEAERLWAALKKIAELRFSDCDEPFDDALAIADAALASPQPAVQGPVAAGDEDEAERIAKIICIANGDDPDRLTYHHNGEVLEPYGDRWVHDLPAARAIIADRAAIRALVSPADPKTPDAGVGEPCPHPKTYDRGECCGGHCPAPAGEDETGVREAALEKALRFYADPKNWIDTPPWDGDPETITPLAVPVDRSQDGSPCDCGDIARKALASLAPQPPKAETPAGVGEALNAVKAVADDLAQACVDEGDSKAAGALQFISGFVSDRLFELAALSTAPAARPGDGVGLTLREAFSCADAADWQRLNDFLDESGRGRFWKAVFAQIRTELAAAPAADGGRA